MEDVIIKVENLSKDFRLPHERTTSIKSAVVNFYRHRSSYEDQQALKDVSFDVKKGEFFGIVGRNGSGKSTLLKILAGIYVPTNGSVEVRGNLTPFIELGVGFNPELTGRENVFLNGALLGFNRKEMKAMYNDIVDFAELERFMDQKLKNYSSGMQVRLAFSIAIRAQSDILLIDEVLAVGDANFQKKSIEVFEDLKREGRTIIFISHSMSQVRQFCDRVAVLHDGKILYDGDPEKAIDVYNRINLERENSRMEAENKKDNLERIGNGHATITTHQILSKANKETVELVSGEEFTTKLVVKANQPIQNVAAGIMFRKDPEENLFGLNSYTAGHPIKQLGKGEAAEITFKDKLPLNPGTYYVSYEVATMTSTGYEDLDYLKNAFRVNVVGPELFWGPTYSSPKISIKTAKTVRRSKP